MTGPTGGIAVPGLSLGSDLGVGTAALGAVDGGYDDTAFGEGALAADVSGYYNTAMGYDALEANTSGVANTAVGALAMENAVSGTNNVAVGSGALYNNADGGANTAIGYEALTNLGVGAGPAIGNVAVGATAGYNCHGAESYDILIGSGGVNGESNAIRVGDAYDGATGKGQNAAYIAGIAGTQITGGSTVVVSSSGQLGVASVPSAMTFLGAYAAGTAYVQNDVVTFAGTSYICTDPSGCTSEIPSGSSSWNATTLPSTSYASNLAVGKSALGALDGGTGNTGLGQSALADDTIGDNNTALGWSALQKGTAIYSNTAVGGSALQGLVSGSGNTAVGDGAGMNYTGSESYNVDIGVAVGGAAGESNVIRIGSPYGAGLLPNTFVGENATYIAGISGTTVSGAEVFVTTSGQLGTMTSSRRFKEDIRDIGDESRLLMSLRPVAFKYRPEYEASGSQQYGLIAEEVEQVAPQLVIYNDDGTVQTVRYNLVNALMLNEVQRLSTENQTLQSAHQKSEAMIADLTSRVAQLAARLEVLEGRVR